MLSCVSGFLPTNDANIHIFFTINAPLEYYFFRYKEMETFTEGKKEELYSPPKTSIKRKTPRTTYVIKVVRGIFNLLLL